MAKASEYIQPIKLTVNAVANLLIVSGRIEKTVPVGWALNSNN